MSFIISTGRPYILIAYFCTALLYFLLSNFNKRSSENLYTLFLGLVGGALVSLNYLGMTIFGCLLIALLIANFNVLDKFIKPIFISIVLAVVCSLPFLYTDLFSYRQVDLSSILCKIRSERIYWLFGSYKGLIYFINSE